MSTFPTAVFSGDLVSTDAGYEAQGTLKVRDITQDVSFPFDLSFEGDQAIMTGATSLNRLDYGVGLAMNDEGTLGFGVDISLSVTAKRTE